MLASARLSCTMMCPDLRTEKKTKIRVILQSEDIPAFDTLHRIFTISQSKVDDRPPSVCIDFIRNCFSTDLHLSLINVSQFHDDNDDEYNQGRRHGWTCPPR